MIRRLRLAAFAILVTISSVARATDDDFPVPRGPSREPAPYRYDPAVWAKVPKEFREDAPAVTIYTGTSHIVEDDGTVETITHEVTRLNGRKGVDSLGEYRGIYYDPDYQKLTLNVARVLKANGTVVPIEPKHMQLRDVVTDFQVYDRDKQLVISFPNLEVGDAYEVKWTVRGKNPEFDGKFFTRYTFGDDTYPVARDELHVLISPKLTFKYAAIGGKVPLRITEQGGKKHYYWHVTDRPELPKEDDKPSKEELRLQVACSTFASWDEVGRWKQKLRAECWKCLPEVKKTVDDVTRGLNTPVEKARALTYWVRRHVRYLSRGPSGTGYTPHLPHQVLANLFGDCKDQAQLLAVMLREVGLSPYLVTLGTLEDGQVSADVPSPWGTHAILMVPIDGREHWIDTTVSQAAWNYLPRADRDRLVYVTRDAELKLMRTPKLTYADHRTVQTTEVKVWPDGSTSNTRSSLYHGGAALARRDAWIETPPGERRRLMSTELQDANARSRLVALRVHDSDLREFDRPVAAQIEYRIPGQFNGEAGKEASVTDSIVWARLLSYTLDPDRQLPLNLGSPFESIHQYVIELPPAFRFDDVPREQNIKSPWGFFKLSVRQDAKKPRRLELVLHTRLAKVRIEPRELARFQKFQEDVGKAYRVWLNIRYTSELADAPFLEWPLAAAPWSDPISASVLAKLYLDNARYADARRVLAVATLCFPQRRDLWDLRVKAAANLAEEEDTLEQMRDLFPKEATIAVALGATRVKRGEHAAARKVLEPLTVHLSDVIRGSAHYQLARSYYQDGNAKAALKHLEAAALSEVNVLSDASALHFKARVQQSLGHVPEAIAAYREALKVENDDLDTLAALIRLEAKAGQTSDALDHLRRFTLAAGKDPSVLTRAAEMHLELGRLDDAFELASRARAAGFVVDTQRVLGLVHLRRQEHERAVFHLERVDPDAEVLDGLIRSYLALGAFAKAERHAETANNLDEDKDTPALRKTLEGFRKLVQRRDQLLQEASQERERLEDSAKQKARTTIERFLCAELAHEDATRRADAERLLRGCFESGFDLGPAFALRGLLALEKGNVRAALADADRAVQLKPVEARTYQVRGRARLERGAAGALDDLQRAAELSKRKDGVILHWLAAALSEAGRRNDALAAQRQAAELRPDDADIAEQLRKLEKVEPGR